ncbi:MFS transporter [Candidatus Amarobacter glycogenicus]|uniref:MFS transporter n=1 Tax=Candidatus Amarobacter glycogenicus TaxID=3140699 RepID=UPI002A117355|nr:MFS transporter [Dehalococcoidia bacterium]
MASATRSPAPGSRWKQNLAFVWIGVFVGLMGANFVFPFIPFYIKELGVTKESEVAFYTSLTASATGLSLTLTAPIWGSLADRYGRKPMFLRALIGAGVLIAVMGVAQAVWQLVLLRFLMGAFAGTMGAAAALVAATTPRAKVGYALGLLQTGQFFANMLGPVIGGVVAASLGIRESFVFCAALYIAAAALVYFFVREEPIDEPEGNDGCGKPRGGSFRENIAAVVSERQVIFMLLLLFSLWLSTTFVRPVMPISIDKFADGERVHLEVPGWTADLKEEAATGLVFGVIGLTSTIGALAVAPLGQRIGYRNTVATAALVTGALYPTVALANGAVPFALLLGAVGLFQGAMVPGTSALIAASTPEGKQGSTFGLAASMQSLALMLGPIGGGFTTGVAGIESVYVVIGLILLAAGGAAFLFVREPSGFGKNQPSEAR